jgi:hypothetical protein
MIPRALANGADHSGVWAVLDGLTFKATRVKADGTIRLGYTGAGFPGHPDFTYDERRQVWQATMPADRCDSVTNYSPRADYRGRPCTVVAIHEDSLGLYLIGDDVAAHDLGFETLERGVYWRDVPFAELDSVYHVAEDLLFPLWQAATFGVALDASNWADHPDDPNPPEIGYPRLRTGRHASVDGREYAVRDDTLVAPDGTTRPLPAPGDLDALTDVSVAVGYHGATYDVAAAWPGGSLTLRCEGPNLDGQTAGRADWALRQGFTEVQPGRYEKQVHIGAVYSYREVRRNVLFDLWKAGQTAPSGA